jgi:hypothetical protein
MTDPKIYFVYSNSAYFLDFTTSKKIFVHPNGEKLKKLVVHPNLMTNTSKNVYPNTYILTISSRDQLVPNLLQRPASPRFRAGKMSKFQKTS